MKNRINKDIRRENIRKYLKSIAAGEEIYGRSIEDETRLKLIEKEMVARIELQEKKKIAKSNRKKKTVEPLVKYKNNNKGVAWLRGWV